MCLDDINHNGDIVVGAPYEETSGDAVYIFNGNRDVSRKYNQKLAILADDSCANLISPSWNPES